MTITVGTDRDELKQLAQEVDTSGLKFSDPKGARRKRLSKKFIEERAKLHEEKRMTRTPPKSPSSQGTVDRANIFLEGEVNSDPVEAVRQRLTKMWVMETRINDDLYAAKELDHAAISASNKRLLELSQGLKALPSQTAGENKGTQKSLAEAIVDAQNEQIAQSKESIDNGTTMLQRADTAFGDGAS